jgi:hypothetical protein
MRSYIKLLIVAFCFSSLSAHAWIPNGETVTIDEIIQWNGDGPVYFKLSNNHVCYIPAAEKNAYSLILALYMSGKPASVHCFDSEETSGGIKGHRLHRIIAVKQ